MLMYILFTQIKKKYANTFLQVRFSHRGFASLMPGNQVHL